MNYHLREPEFYLLPNGYPGSIIEIVSFQAECFLESDQIMISQHKPFRALFVAGINPFPINATILNQGKGA